jgi:hypothetical protein
MNFLAIRMLITAEIAASVEELLPSNCRAFAAVNARVPKARPE